MGKTQARRESAMKNKSWKLWIFVAFIAVALVIFGASCSTSAKEQKSESGKTEHTHGEETHTHDEEGKHVHSEETHTHGEEGEHTHGQEGEESREKLALTDTYDHVHKGVRLVLAYHNASSSFIGSVENVTDKTIKKVRVEVHLSTGVELGPTERIDLAPGEKAGIKLEAKGHVFEWWTTHAESGSSEHSQLVN
jgi:hypothetical protein